MVFFENPDLTKFVDLLLNYFDQATGQHSQFTEVISSLVDQALEALSDIVERESDNNSFIATSEYQHNTGRESERKNAVTFREDHQQGGWKTLSHTHVEPPPRPPDVTHSGVRNSAFSPYSGGDDQTRSR